MVRVGGKFVDIGNIVPQAVSFPAIKVISQQIKWTGLMHYNPWIMPSATGGSRVIVASLASGVPQGTMLWFRRKMFSGS